MQILSLPTTLLYCKPIRLNKLTFTLEQRQLLSHIFHALNLKIDTTNCHKRNLPEKITLDTSSETLFLKEILAIVEDHLPKTLAEIRKCNDYLLKRHIKAHFKNIAILKDTLDGWSSLLNSRANVFETTCPHSQNDAAQLQTIGSNYTALVEGDLVQITKDNEAIIRRINLRIRTFIERKISIGSLALLKNVHDIPLECIESNIQTYRDTTNYFKNALVEIEKKHFELEEAKKAFKKNFCKVNYAIEKNFFYLYSMPKYKASPSSVVQKKGNIPPNPCFETLTDDQMNAIQNIFNILFQKHHSLDVENRIQCRDPFFKCHQKMSNCWTPIGVHKKEKFDDQLLSEPPPLLETINSLALKFDELEQKYLNYIVRFSKFYDKENSREEDLICYTTLSKELAAVAKKKRDLDERLNQRIALDVKKNVSTETLKIICCSHDISLENLIENIERFHQKTEICQARLQILADSTVAMNKKISAFCSAFNYFSYLFENGLMDTTLNKSYFTVSHALGHLNFIQVGNFKQPPELEYQSEEEYVHNFLQEHHTYTEDEDSLT